MSELHFPWLEAAVVLPLLGAAWISRIHEPGATLRKALVICGITLAMTLGAWLDFLVVGGMESHDWWNPAARLLGSRALVLDDLSAPKLSLTALVFLMTVLSTARTKARRFPFASMLVSESLLLATFASKSPWGIVALLAASTIVPLVELKSRNRPMRVYLLHMGLFVVSLAAGVGLTESAPTGSVMSNVGVVLLLLAVGIRCGIVPLHCWITDLFEHATFGTALLFVTPMSGAYAAMRLVLPYAPAWSLRVIALASLFTAVYAAGMALVQRESRRFFCYLFVSHSALVLVGLAIATPISLTGGLSVWLSVGLAITGFGLTLRSMEARTGRLSLDDYHGLYEHAPTLAAFFLLTGLAGVGFPGTFGFVGIELLVDGAVGVYPYIGTTVVVAAALNGIAVLFGYFRVFTGARHTASIALSMRPTERVAILTLATLILGGGIFPQPGVASRYHAAMEIVSLRKSLDAAGTGNGIHAETDSNRPRTAALERTTDSGSE